MLGIFLFYWSSPLPHKRHLLPSIRLQRRNENIFDCTDQPKCLTFFKVIGANMIFALLTLVNRAAVHREIPFQEVAASIRAVACLGGAAVLPVVVREGVALVTGVVVLVCNGGVKKGLQSSNFPLNLENRKTRCFRSHVWTLYTRGSTHKGEILKEGCPI